MKPSKGYEQMDAVGGGMVTGIASNGEAEVTGLASHIVLSAKPVTNCFGHLSCDM